jgi:hypothetical protein
MPQVEFEPTISVFKRAKTVHALEFMKVATRLARSLKHLDRGTALTKQLFEHRALCL